MSSAQMLAVVSCGLLMQIMSTVGSVTASTQSPSPMDSEHYLVEPLPVSACDLGEGPYWHPNQSALYYVDAFMGYVHRHEKNDNGTKHSKVNLGDLVTIVIPIEGDHRLLVSLRNKIVKLDWANETYDVVAEVAKDKGGKERFNDGKIDALGRLWIGTVLDGEDDVVKGGGSLYKLQNDTFIKMSENFTISNGMSWNHNSTIMYFNDSEDRKTYRFDYNLTEGTISNKTILVDYSKRNEFGSNEYPDGMAIDSEEKIWIALYGGARIVRIDPQTGNLLASIPIGAPQTTSITFGGANFTELYITTGNGDVKNNENLQRKYPNAGKIFKVTQKSTPTKTIVKGGTIYKFIAQN